MESLNQETGVQGDKVMQDIESESFSKGGDHSQKVKAPPIENDYGSRDCVNLPHSTPVSWLKKVRDRIDWLDAQIASLLNERMRAVDQVGKIKRANHLLVDDQSRENRVLDEVQRAVQHPVLKANIARIYRKIMEESRMAQVFFQTTLLPFKRIGIVGLGLMGGSICKALKLKEIEISSVVHDSEDYAKVKEWLDKEYNSLQDLVLNVDLLILATPLAESKTLVNQLKGLDLPCKLLVMDIGSVKSDIVELFEQYSNDRIEYIGTHPMAGKETRGFENSEATLFVNQPWIIVPHKKNVAESIENMRAFIRYLGAKPMCLEAAVHDQQAALVSHLPALISKSYYDFVHSTDPASLLIAGPGFQTFTRLAHDSAALSAEVGFYNKKIIEHLLKGWLEHIGRES